MLKQKERLPKGRRSCCRIYPFQMYVHWIPVDAGSILYSDGKFLSVIYKQHDDHFDDYTKYRDAHSETKNNIFTTPPSPARKRR